MNIIKRFQRYQKRPESERKLRTFSVRDVEHLLDELGFQHSFEWVLWQDEGEYSIEYNNTAINQLRWVLGARPVFKSRFLPIVQAKQVIAQMQFCETWEDYWPYTGKAAPLSIQWSWQVIEGLRANGWNSFEEPLYDEEIDPDAV